METLEETSVLEKDWVFKFFVSPGYRFLRHFLLILFITLVIFNSQPQFIEPVMTIIRMILVLLFVLLFYTNMYWLVPGFCSKISMALMRYGLSLLLLLLLLVIF